MDAGKPPAELGRYLRSLREGRGDPQWRVAAAAQMDSASLSKIELGERLPTQEQAALLAAFFEVPASDMEGRRIVAKFWLENGDNPAVAEAVQRINDTAPAYVVNKPVNKPEKTVNRPGKGSE